MDLGKELVLIAVGVELHTDALDVHALGKPSLEHQVIYTLVAGELWVAKGLVAALVPEESRIGEILLRNIKAPFFVISVIANGEIAATEFAVCISLDGVHFVYYVEVNKIIAVALRNLAAPLLHRHF